MSALTVLTATGRKQMAKAWTVDGTIRGTDEARWFKLTTVPVSDLADLSAKLTMLTGKSQSCVIRQAPVSPDLLAQLTQEDGYRPGLVLRQSKYFADQPLHPIMIDVDGWPHEGDPVAGMHAFIAAQLPECFRGADFHWQLSGSSGHPSKAGKLNAHLWFWLRTPYTSAQLYAWAKTLPGVDAAVYRPVQAHYTADPVFDEGVVDPVPVRSGMETLFISEDVDLVLDEAALAAVHAPSLRGVARSSDAGLDPVADYLYDHWTVYGEKDGRLQILCPLAEYHSGDSGITQCVWTQNGVGGVAAGGVYCVHETHGGKGKLTTSLFLKLIGYTEVETAAEFDVIEQPVVNPAALLPGPPPFNSGVAWPELERNKAGIVPTVRNTLAALGHPDLCGARVAWDDFKALMLVEWIDEQGEWRAFKDTDYVRLREVLEKRGFRKLGADLVRECVARVAEINTMDSAMTWVRGLQWDGKPRAETFFIDCFGVEDSPYTRAVGRYVWTALAGRAVSPGCKADMVPVLIGAQGLGKTTGVEALCPTEDAFVELSLDIHDDNLARKMRGKLVGEIGELRGLAGKDADAIKQWLSRREEEWTPKYREFTVRFPRRLVLFGTGNKTEFLEDETGNRRWLPMTVGANVDLDRIRRERDQLWAEGRTMFCAAGHSVDWREAQDLARVEHAAYHVGDDWTELVAAWLDADAMDEADGPKRGAQPFKTVDVLAGALGLPASRIDRRASLRIGKVMHGLGYKMHPISVEGHLQKMWIDKNDPRYPKT